MVGMALLAAALLCGCGSTRASAITYYVCNDSSCPAASNANSGKREDRPWRTIGRANRQSLKPGDAVLLKGGDTFREHELWPSSSGSEGKPIVYGSYGTGHAILKLGIWIPPSRSWVTIENLTIDGSEHGGAIYDGMDGVAGSAKGHDEHISILHDTFEHLSIAINGEAPEHALGSDSGWLIAGNTINGTGDSGIYVQGTQFTIEHNTIENTGLDGDRHVNEHGIYLRAVNSRVLYNTITHFAADGVSVRYHNSRVEGNTISYGQEGIAWFQYDSVAGISTWSNNSISHVTGAGIYVSPANKGGETKESFIILNNTLARVGTYMDLRRTSGTYEVRGNKP
jgi:parallel beta-helix repeat protein